MKLPTIKRLTASDMPEMPGWARPLVLTLNAFMQFVFEALNRQLTFQDNIRSQILTARKHAPFDGFRIDTTIAPITGVLLLGVTGQPFSTPPVLRWRADRGTVVIEELTGLTTGELYEVKLLVL